MTKRVRKNPPAYHRRAEQALQRALRAQRQGAWHNALLWLGQALERDARLMQDATALQLAAQLTELEAERSVKLLADPTLRTQFILYHTKRQPMSLHLPLSTLLSVLVVVGLLFVVLVDNFDAIRRAINEFGRPAYAVDINSVAAVDYLTVLPDGDAPPQGWPMLLALPEDASGGRDLVNLLAPATREAGVLLAVAEFGIYPPLGEEVATQLDVGVLFLGQLYPLADGGPVVFGVGPGGELASLYTLTFPARGLATSSAPYIHPQERELPLLLMYAQNDPLLDSEAGIGFTDIREWDEPLDYVVLDGLSTAFDPEQIPLLMTFIQTETG